MKDKEKALQEFIYMTLHSWTYDRMTEREKEKCLEALKRAKLRGSFFQRWEILHSVYYGFLLALDYKPIGWREPETSEHVPKF